ncbi:hypothetical protein GCM10017673_18590 [Streptosporangium violaceochromogenes]|nr:hypothetical protein GCM10017673_18590 [Streptosporangium violaceochromogenes]
MRQGIHGIGVRLGRQATVRSLLIVSLRTLDGKVFGEPDAFAWVQGWQIGRGRLLRRTYRDARFALLLECGLCHGEGTGGGAGTGCSLCDGTGRLDRLRPAERP